MRRANLSTTMVDHEFTPPKYYEAWAEAVTSNTVWKVAVLLLFGMLGVCVVTIGRQSRQIASVANQRIVVRINDVGRPEAVSYRPADYKPQELEVKYFLTQQTHNYFSRVHATVVRDYGASFYFFDQPLMDRLNAEDARSQWLKKFLSSDADDCEVNVDVPVIDDLEREPYRAHVEWQKVCTRNGMETGREKYVTQYQFVIRPRKPTDRNFNDWLKFNPLGLVITYFRSDQYFAKGQQ